MSEARISESSAGMLIVEVKDGQYVTLSDVRVAKADTASST